MKRIYTSRSLLTLLIFTVFSLFGGGNFVKAQTLIPIFEEYFAASTGTMGWSGNVATGTLTADKTGWIFQNGYGAGGSAKFGTKSSLGSATTPALNYAGNATLTFKAGAWSGDQTTLKISVLNGGSSDVSSVSIPDAQWGTFTVKLINLTEASQVKFEGAQASKSRFFLDDVVVSVESTGSSILSIPTLDLSAGEYIIGQTLTMTAPAGANLVYSVNDGAEINVASETAGYRFPATGTYSVKAKSVPAVADDSKTESDWTDAVTYNVVENIVLSGAETDVVIWSENFEGMTTETKPSNYVFTNGGSTTAIYTSGGASAGSELPELLISKSNGVFKVTLDDLKGLSGDFTLTFKSNKGCTISTTAPCSVSDYSFTDHDASCKVNVPAGTTSLILMFTNTDTKNNTRVDDFLLVGKKIESSVGDYYPFTISSFGVSTFAARKAYVMPEGLQGGIVEVDANQSVANVTYMYEAGDIVPAEEALLLKGEAGKDYALVLTSEDGTAFEENLLRPALTYDAIEAGSGEKFYIFSYDDSNNLGFFIQGATGDGSKVEGIYGKGYLAAPATLSGVRGFLLSAGDVTGIESAVSDKVSGNVYTLGGVRVSGNVKSLPAGFYIVNGRKVMVK